MSKTMNRRTFAALLAVPAVGRSVSARPASPIRPPSRDFQRQIPTLMEVAGVPGVGMSVVSERGRVWEYFHGVANADEGRPVSADTLWAAASLGKPVFAFAALRLADDGLLDLDRPLKSYLPDHAPNDARGDRITARHVLSHSSGLRNWRGGSDAPLVPDFEPGSQFQYSGEGYYYLQRVVEHVVGAGFEQFMQERLLGPLGMRSSTYSWRADSTARVVAGHDRRDTYTIYWQDIAEKLLRYAAQKGRPLASFTYEDVQAGLASVAPKARTLPQFLIPNAASSLLTTPAEYGAFLTAVLGGGPARVSLKPATRKAMLAPRIQINGALGWGLGWGIEEKPNLIGRAGGVSPASDYLWQWGDNGSWKNFALAHPASGSAIVVFTNGSHGLNLARCIVSAATGFDHSAFLWL